MSLSSKLRDFRKTIKKKNKNACPLEDEQVRKVARHMPREEESLEQFLSKEQMDAFGDALLDITRGHTSRDQDLFEECIREVGAFVRGGLPGMCCFCVHRAPIAHDRVLRNGVPQSCFPKHRQALQARR